MSNSTFANGQVLTSSAQTPDSMAVIFQALTAQILGFDPVNNPSAAFNAVRVAWPQAGQPGYGIGDDICIVGCTQKSDNYSAIRDQLPTNPINTTVDLTITYVRVWNVHFEVNGPNCFDHARLIRDAMFLSWTKYSLSASAISLVPRETEPVYVPYLQNSQWWKRVDIDLEFNELVTETTSVNSIASAEVIVSDGGKLNADLTVTA